MGWGGGVEGGASLASLWDSVQGPHCEQAGGGEERKDRQTDREGGKRAWGRLEQARTLRCRRPVRQCRAAGATHSLGLRTAAFISQL